MFTKRKRFSLLQLEDEEDYVADWVVSATWPAGVGGNWGGRGSLPGRLRAGSRNLYYEPDDLRVPIVRFPFTALSQLEGEGGAALVLTTTSLTQLKARGEDHPYTVLKATPTTWRFSLTYAKLDACLPLVQQYLAASRLPPPDRTAMLRQLALAAEDALVFDSSRLVDFREGAAWEGPVAQVTPLSREPGRLAVTGARLYFQPLHNVTGDAAMRSHPLSAVGAVVRRRAALQPTGLELFFLNPTITTSSSTTSSVAGAGGAEAGGGGVQRDAGAGSGSGPTWGASSAFFSFRSEADRDAALAAILRQQQLGAALRTLLPPLPGLGTTTPSSGSSSGPPLHALAGQLLEAGSSWLPRVTAAWVAGRLTNFDYLLYLNLAAGRTFNDLAQWPVYPWVLADYTSPTMDLAAPATYRDLSKPMGALTPGRLSEFRKRYQDMASLQQDLGGDAASSGMPPPFMYGTHYSTPGYVLYWLVRAAPAHMLRLQAGRFDAPDRLFHALASSWDSATSSTTDVKELIPEFYMGNPDFLVNTSRLPLGVRQNGTPVGDVALPPWAGGSPARFLALHRAALESPAVSATLHAWIDLVFGYKQRGAAAVAADNVFYHLTYEGAVDISQVTDPQELHALQVQVNEFGQTPRQLFTCPHPPRTVLPPAPDPEQLLEEVQQGGQPARSSSPGPGGAAAAPAGGGAGASSSSGLVNAGEDGGGGSVAMSLLHTLVAALEAAPGSTSDATPQGSSTLTPPGATTTTTSSSSSSSKAVPIPGSQGAARAGPGQGVEAGGGLSLSPPDDADVVCAHPLTLPLPAAPRAPAAARGGGLLASLPTTGGTQALLGLLQRVSLQQPATPQDQQQQQQQHSNVIVPPSGAQRLGTTPALGGGSQGPPPGAVSPTAALSASASGAVGAAEASWPDGAARRLLLTHSIKLQRQPLSGVAACPHSGQAAVVGQDGLLRILQLPGAGVSRSSQLSEDLFSCCALPPAGHDSAAAPAGSTWLLGGSRGTMLAYSAAAGRLLGSWAAHDDASSCCCVLGAAPTTLLTGSWDCSVKTWDLAEGRQPWSSTLPLPTAVFRDMDAGVWAVTAAPSGQLVGYGTEEGVVGAVDLRTMTTVWSASISADYIGGLRWLPGSCLLGTAAADGSMTILDWRCGGQPIARVDCGMPLRCCTGDARYLLAGSEGGHIHVWGVSRLTGVTSSSTELAAGGLEGLGAPLTCESKAPINAVCMSADNVSGASLLLAAQDDGTVAIFSS